MERSEFKWGEGAHEKPIYSGDCLKAGLDSLQISGGMIQ